MSYYLAPLYQMIKLGLLNIFVRQKKFHLLLTLLIWCLVVVAVVIVVSNGNRNQEQQQQQSIQQRQRTTSITSQKRPVHGYSIQANQMGNVHHSANSALDSFDTTNHQHRGIGIINRSLQQNPALLPVANQNGASPLDALNVMRGRRSSGAGHRSTANLPKVKVLILIMVHQDQEEPEITGNVQSKDMRNIKTGLDKMIHSNHNLRFIVDILESEHIGYSIDTTRHGMPDSLLTNHQGAPSQHQPVYPVIIVDDLIKYSTLNRWLKDQLDRHCRTNQIGMIGFFDPALGRNSPQNHHQQQHQQANKKISQYPISDRTHTLIEGFPLYYRRLPESQLQDYRLNPKSSIPRLLKTGPDLVLQGQLPANVDHSPWFTLSSDHVTYEPIGQARIVNRAASRRQATTWRRKLKESLLNPKSYPMASFINTTSRLQDENGANKPGDYDALSSDNVGGGELTTLVVADHGLYDGIRRVIFGGGAHFWYHRVLLLDSIGHLSNGGIISSLDRYIQIDIDDIFVGEVGTRMKIDDVNELVEAQRQFQSVIDGGFKFHLGYSGKYYLRGNELEDAGDRQLIKLANEFNWFCHTWSHSRAHLSGNSNRIEHELMLNQQFAKKYNLPVISTANSDDALSPSPPNHDQPHQVASNPQDSTVTPMSLRYDDLSLAGIIMNETTATAMNTDEQDTDNQIDQRHQQQQQPWQTNRPSGTYSVAPHHSGVFPIHEPLYEAWRKVLNVQVTTTEEYPHLRPAKFRKGFIYKDIMVLPRQTCGLYTHTIFMDKYPGGKQKLDQSVRGGELFQTILHNPVSVFMTHLSNYGNDRLALYTFSALINFIMKWTNIQLKYNPNPLELARYYFELRPHEVDPIWLNPCHDKRHVQIWNRGEKWCQKERLPKFLIVGPQKTGTTALHTFLQAHPKLRTSKLDPGGKFEEIQFFNSENYLNGLDWYIGLFSHHFMGANSTHRDADQEDNEVHSLSGSLAGEEYYLFEKSATYFDDPRVPERASALLPRAKIIMIFINPLDRAYSWYQHMRAHGDKIATSFTFHQIITATDDRAPKKLLQLRSRCLTPGHYSSNLQRWLSYYPSDQIIVIDGHWFRQNPSSVINKLQTILNIEPVIDFNDLLVYDKKKGFFCQSMPGTTNSKGSSPPVRPVDEHRAPIRGANHAARRDSHRQPTTKCLGKGKGRKYPPMEMESRQYLRRYYMPHNRQLAHLLSNQLRQPLPNWLEDEISAFG